jgi:iron-sulfur cluster insertion protein
MRARIGWRRSARSADGQLPLRTQAPRIDVGSFEEAPVITLTDKAADKVKELLEAEGADDLALRVAVRPGGCSGFSYEMFFDGDIAADDEQAEFGADQSVRVIVDAASAQLLVGATLDYKDGLDQSGFAITNPNATRTCGCGQSFS